MVTILHTRRFNHNSSSSYTDYRQTSFPVEDVGPRMLVVSCPGAGAEKDCSPSHDASCVPSTNDSSRHLFSRGIGCGCSHTAYDTFQSKSSFDELCTDLNNSTFMTQNAVWTGSHIYDSPDFDQIDT